MSETPLESFMSSRTIGEATVTIVNEGTIDWAPNFNVEESCWRQVLPEADAQGMVTLGLNIAHVQLGDASILIDPGYDRPDTVWGRHFAGRFRGTTRTPGLDAALAGIGVRPDEITHVLITHVHADHIGGVMVESEDGLTVRFPNARHFIGRDDWEGNPTRERPGTEVADRLAPIDRLGLLELVDGDREVSPGVTMISTPGETPGHCIVRVDSGDARFLYLGDLFHHPKEAEHLDWVSPGRDQPKMIASRQRVIDEARERDTLLVFTHSQFPPWGRLVSQGDGVRWEPA